MKKIMTRLLLALIITGLVPSESFSDVAAKKHALLIGLCVTLAHCIAWHSYLKKEDHLDAFNFRPYNPNENLITYNEQKKKAEIEHAQITVKNKKERKENRQNNSTIALSLAAGVYALNWIFGILVLTGNIK